MRCRHCKERAGWWRRVCNDCRRLAAAFAANRGAHMGAMIEVFLASGVPHRKVEAFLDSNLDGSGSVRDQIAADMTNQLMGMLGRQQRQTADEVKRIRQRGNWVSLDRRPRE